jgi:hypothetical protein
MNASLDALAQLVKNLGPDPMKIPVTLPGALDIFLGTIKLQLPVLANSEWSAVQTDAQAQIASVKARLAAAITPTP